MSFKTRLIFQATESLLFQTRRRQRSVRLCIEFNIRFFFVAPNLCFQLLNQLFCQFSRLKKGKRVLFFDASSTTITAICTIPCAIHANTKKPWTVLNCTHSAIWRREAFLHKNKIRVWVQRCNYDTHSLKYKFNELFVVFWIFFSFTSKARRQIISRQIENASEWVCYNLKLLPFRCSYVCSTHTHTHSEEKCACLLTCSSCVKLCQIIKGRCLWRTNSKMWFNKNTKKRIKERHQIDLKHHKRNSISRSF